MNKIKKIYYPVLAVLTLVALVIGLVSAAVSFAPKASNTVYTRMTDSMNFEHNSYTSNSSSHSQDSVRNALVDIILARSGALESAYAYESNGYEDASFGSTPTPKYLTQNATLTQEAVADLSDDEQMFYVDGRVRNIVVAIPGKTLDEAVLLSANYDSAAGSQSATECMEAVALLEAAVKCAEDYQSGKVPDKTLLFVVTDAEHEGGYGLRAFKTQFNGFDGIARKVGLAINFGASGTGPLSVFADKISISKAKGFASGLIRTIDSGERFYDYEVYDCAKMNVFFGGNKEYLNTARDTVENLSKSKVDTLYGTMLSFINTYGYGDFSVSNADGAFSYAGISVSYSKVVPYVIGGLALVLLILAAVMMARNKRLGSFIKGTLIQLLAIALTAAILYVCYFLLALILAGFGILPVQAITSVIYMNVGLFISGLLLALTAYVGVFLLLRRFYKIKATDGARGAAALIVLLGAIMAFALPQGSLGFALSALLEGALLVVTSVLSTKFKAKYGADIERLLLYFVPIVLFTPAMIPVMIMAGYSLSLVYFPFILTVAVLGMAVVAPYFATLRPVLENAVKKLPKHTIRVERTVTERVEGAKKGRFTEVTHKKVTNEKVEWNYRNRYAVIIMGVLSVVLVLLFAGCPTRYFGTNATNTFSYREAIKNDSVVFVWDLQGDSVAEADSKLVVNDLAAYKYIQNIDNEFVWNNADKTFDKMFLGDVTDLFDTNTPVSITTSGGILTINSYGNGRDSFIDIKFTNIEAVTEITVQASGKRIEITNDGKSTLNLVLPYGDDDYKSFTVEFDVDADLNNGSENVNVGVEYTQYISGVQALSALEDVGDFNSINNDFDRLYDEDLNYGIILHKTSSYQVGN